MNSSSSANSDLPQNRHDYDGSRQLLAQAIADGQSLYATVIRISITHRAAYIKFHESQCPFIGFGAACSGVSWFEGEPLRCGPHRFKVSNYGIPKGGKREQWCIHSEDNTFKIVAEQISYVDENVEIMDKS